MTPAVDDMAHRSTLKASACMSCLSVMRWALFALTFGLTACWMLNESWSSPRLRESTIDDLWLSTDFESTEWTSRNGVGMLRFVGGDGHPSTAVRAGRSLKVYVIQPHSKSTPTWQENKACTPDNVTQAERAASRYIELAGAFVTQESVQASSPCVTQSVDRLISVPVANATVLASQLASLGVVVRDHMTSSEVALGGGESIDSVALELEVTRDRLKRYTDLYGVATKLAQKASILVDVMKLDSEVLTLEHKVKTLSTAAKESFETIHLRLVGQSIRWVEERNERNFNRERQTYRLRVLFTTAVIALASVTQGLLWMLRRRSPPCACGDTAANIAKVPDEPLSL